MSDSTERVKLGELTREEVRGLAPKSTVVITTGAIEQHGPHLPIDFDTRVGLHICEAAARQASQHVPLLVAPPFPYGISNHHKPHAGVLSLSPQTYLAALTEITCCLVESGFKRIAIVNAHGGNQDVNAVVAREARNRHGISVAATSYWTVAQQQFAATGISAEAMSLPGHAGKFETSLLLAVQEDIVRMNMAPEGKPFSPPKSSYAKGSSVYIAGKRQGDNHGYSDQPGAATRADGERYLKVIIQCLSDFLVQFHREHPDS